MARSPFPPRLLAGSNDATYAQMVPRWTYVDRFVCRCVLPGGSCDSSRKTIIVYVITGCSSDLDGDRRPENASPLGGLLRRSAESIAPLNSYLQPLCIRKMPALSGRTCTFDHLAMHCLHHIFGWNEGDQPSLCELHQGSARQHSAAVLEPRCEPTAEDGQESCRGGGGVLFVNSHAKATSPPPRTLKTLKLLGRDCEGGARTN